VTKSEQDSRPPVIGAPRALVFVPVRPAPAGTFTLRTGRLPSGERTGLAFTSEAALLLAMGPAQQWIRLGEHALRAMLSPLGITRLRIDPRPIAERGVVAEPHAAERRFRIINTPVNFLTVC
jgi:hypothetical protein